MNIFITGVAGFIGFNSAMSLLKKNSTVYGIDIFDKYYSTKLKLARLKKLKSNKNFHFKKVDLKNKTKLFNLFKNKKIDLILHYAAQPGVRYSFVNPSKYIDTNFFGFLNIVMAAKKNNVKKIIYASSSSVYGDSKKLPVNENSVLSKKNIYAVTKKLNEDTAELYSKLTNINFIGLRFFTIFGEWGRPDMLIFKIFNAQINQETLHLNNYGNHYRDFTYIEDAINIVDKVIKKKLTGHHVFNICSNNPINIDDIINNFKSKYKIKIKYKSLHKADVLNTHGNNLKVKKLLNVKSFTNFYKAFYKTFEWYKKNRIYKIS